MTMSEENEKCKKAQAQLSIATSIFAMTAFILMWLGTTRCHFIQFTDAAPNSEIKLEFGIWYYLKFVLTASSDGNTFVADRCTGYPDAMYIDPSWKAARAFSVLAEIFGVVLIVTNFVASCASSADHLVSVGGWDSLGYVLTGLFQGLTLLLLNSDVCQNNAMVQELNYPGFTESCQLGTGAKCTVAATFFWFIAAFTAMQLDIERSRQERYFGSTNDATLTATLIDA